MHNSVLYGRTHGNTDSWNLLQGRVVCVCLFETSALPRDAGSNKLSGETVTESRSGVPGSSSHPTRAPRCRPLRGNCASRNSASEPSSRTSTNAVCYRHTGRTRLLRWQAACLCRGDRSLIVETASCLPGLCWAVPSAGGRWTNCGNTWSRKRIAKSVGIETPGQTCALSLCRGSLITHPEAAGLQVHVSDTTSVPQRPLHVFESRPPDCSGTHNLVPGNR